MKFCGIKCNDLSWLMCHWVLHTLVTVFVAAARNGIRETVTRGASGSSRDVFGDLRITLPPACDEMWQLTQLCSRHLSVCVNILPIAAAIFCHLQTIMNLFIIFLALRSVKYYCVDCVCLCVSLGLKPPLPPPLTPLLIPCHPVLLCLCMCACVLVSFCDNITRRMRDFNSFYCT